MGTAVPACSASLITVYEIQHTHEHAQANRFSLVQDSSVIKRSLAFFIYFI